jgi:hypothetical protein
VAAQEGLERLPVAVAKAALPDDRQPDAPSVEVAQCALVVKQRLVVEVTCRREDEAVVDGEAERLLWCRCRPAFEPRASGGGAGRSPSRSSASRNPMPSFLLRKSMTSPAALQPKQKKLRVLG